MQVTSNAGSYAVMAQLQTQATPSAIAGGASATGASSTSSASGVTTYDFTDMTPNQMKSAAGALAASGKIDSTQALKMMTIGLPFGRQVNGKFVPLTPEQRESYGNTPVNYIQLFQGNMTFLEQNGGANSTAYANDQAILATMQGAQGKVSGVNITA